jgi:hypothetical protein
MIAGARVIRMSAESWDEIVQKMTKHVMSNRLETAEAMKKLQD